MLVSASNRGSAIALAGPYLMLLPGTLLGAATLAKSALLAAGAGLVLAFHLEGFHPYGYVGFTNLTAESLGAYPYVIATVALSFALLVHALEHRRSATRPGDVL